VLLPTNIFLVALHVVACVRVLVPLALQTRYPKGWIDRRSAWTVIHQGTSPARSQPSTQDVWEVIPRRPAATVLRPTRFPRKMPVLDSGTFLRRV
jgi:hypothetical protein